MLVKYTLRFGADEFELNVDVKDEKEFFEKLSFYSSLPKAAPGGSTDLKLRFRTTKENYKYYSLICESEGLEYTFGLENKANGQLFAKGWQAIYRNEEGNAEQSQAPVQVQAPVQQRQVAPVARPIVQPQAQAAPVMPVPQTIVQPVQQAAPAPQPQVQQQQQAAPAPVSAQASSVLSRFKVNK